MTRREGGLQNAVQQLPITFSPKTHATASLLNMQKLRYSHSTHHVTRLKLSLKFVPFLSFVQLSSSQFSKSSLGGSETNCDKARGSNSSRKKNYFIRLDLVSSPPSLAIFLHARTLRQASALVWRPTTATMLAPHSIGRYESIASPTGAVKLLCSFPFFSLEQRLDDDMTDSRDYIYLGRHI